MIRLLIALLLSLSPLLASGQVYMTKSGHAEFKSSVPLHSFTGVSNHLVGKINLADSTVDFYLDLHTLDTGIGRRDNDMLETLEAEKYPFAEFYGTLVSNVNTDSSVVQKVTAKGDFTVHGVTRALSIDGKIQMTENGMHLTASWTINMKDYNIKPPGILFYRVSEMIPISIEATLKPQ